MYRHYQYNYQYNYQYQLTCLLLTQHLQLDVSISLQAHECLHLAALPQSKKIHPSF